MRARRSAGFTLLEIIVALAVFGLLLVGLSQTVRFGLTAWRQDAKLSDGKTDLEAVDRSLRSIIENFAPSEDEARPSITGTANTLTGLTQLRVPDAGPMPVRIEAALAVSGRRLVLRWRPYHHWDRFGVSPPVRETDLMSGVGRIGIEYWQTSGTWTSSWHEPDLPLLIRLRVTLAGKNAPRWPDIVAAPLLSRP
ncbi:PulJ/GspJ family protein [Rhodopila sp.]|uniref:PulJ/GspJ family protein n=1 Tax=Rhodopila sp. TaxID=2480087 RepID=UPI003D11DD05